MLKLFTLRAGLDQLLDENRKHYLQLLYQLFTRAKDGLKEINAAFASYIKVNNLYTLLFDTPKNDMIKVYYVEVFLDDTSRVLFQAVLRHIVCLSLITESWSCHRDKPR